jgi:uncharacterized membrane protein
MNLVPAWAPNIHPVVVHFPIALLTTAAALDLAGWPLRRNRWLRDTATLLYVIGTLAAGAAYLSGRAAAQSIWLPGMAHAIVADHWDWAYRVLWFFGVVTVLRVVLLGWSRRAPSRTLIAAFVLAGLVGVGLLRATGDRGGALVYQHGVGIPRD